MIAGLEEITSGTIKIGEPVQKATEILDIGHLLDWWPKALSGSQRAGRSSEILLFFNG